MKVTLIKEDLNKEITEHFKDRIDLGKAVTECRKAGVKFKIVRSLEEGYRYDLIHSPIVEDAESAAGEEKGIPEVSISKDFEFQTEEAPEALPAVEIVDTIPAEQNEPTEEEKEFGKMASINSLIKGFLDKVEETKSVIITLQNEGASEDVIELLNMISDDTMISVGVLQRALDLSTNAGELLDRGQEIADNVVDDEFKFENNLEDEDGKEQEVEIKKEIVIDDDDDEDDSLSETEKKMLSEMRPDFRSAQPKVTISQSSQPVVSVNAIENEYVDDGDDDDDLIDSNLLSVANSPITR